MKILRNPPADEGEVLVALDVVPLTCSRLIPDHHHHHHHHYDDQYHDDDIDDEDSPQ